MGFDELTVESIQPRREKPTTGEQCDLVKGGSRCPSPNTKAITMLDGGKINLCARHESWQAALAPTSPVSSQDETEDQPEAEVE